MTRSLTFVNKEQNLRLEILDRLDVLGFLAEFEGFSDESKLIREQAKEQTMLLLKRAQRGRLSWGRDVKRVKLISNHLVFEFRMEIVRGDSPYPVRLFLSKNPRCLESQSSAFTSKIPNSAWKPTAKSKTTP